MTKMTKTYEIYSRGGERCWLYSDDTYTLALSDCADPELAQETTETTAAMLADCFSADALRGLLIEMIAQNEAGELSIHELAGTREGKLDKAIELACSIATDNGRNPA